MNIFLKSLFALTLFNGLFYLVFGTREPLSFTLIYGGIYSGLLIILALFLVNFKGNKIPEFLTAKGWRITPQCEDYSDYQSSQRSFQKRENDMDPWSAQNYSQHWAQELRGDNHKID